MIKQDVINDDHPLREFFKTLASVDLVVMLHEAKRFDDPLTVKAVQIVIKEL